MSLPALRYLRSLTFVASTAAACFGAGPAAAPEYTVREWHETEGLPSEEIDSLTLDDRGYIWIAGAGKLSRFDGTDFELSKVPGRVALRRITFWRDPEEGQGLLVAPSSAFPGTDRIDSPNTDGFYFHTEGGFQFRKEPRLAGKAVRTTFTERNGTLWLGCEDGTLLRRHGENADVYAAPPGITAKKAPLFAACPDSGPWVAINDYVARFDGTRWLPVSTGIHEPELRLISSSTGGPWMITQNTISKWNGEKFEEVARIQESIGAHFVQTAIEDRLGNLWIGTRSQGLHRTAGREVVRIPVSHEDIEALLEDPDGNIWVGTNGGGLIRLKTKNFWLYDKSSGLSENFSHTVTEDRDGTVWLANRDGGVARIRDDVVDPISKRANWRSFTATSIFPAAQGGIWITTGIGVYRTRADDPEKVAREPSLANVRLVRVTFVARNGDYWLAVDPDRLVRWRDGRVTSFGPDEGFDGREIRTIAEDSSGVIWVGAADGKLFRSNRDGFEPVWLPQAEEYGFLQELRFEEDGTLLIGTTRKGVLILPNQSTTHLRQLTPKQGLPSGDVTNILHDDFDRYWFASRGGIFSIQGSQMRDFMSGNLRRVHAVMTGKDDGLPQLSCIGRTQPSAWKTHNGDLWFATRRGVVRVEPKLASDASEPAPATITQIKCDGRPQPVADVLRIKSTVRKTEIRFSVLSLSIPEQTVVRYRLDGFDNDWVLQGKNRVATYPRLAAGTYVLYAEASSSAEVWNEQPPLLEIVVSLPWWQSRWAQLAYLAILAICITILVRFWSYRRLRMRLEHSEREQDLERERTRIARNIHDDLGASLTQISLITQTALHKNPDQAPAFEQIFETVRTSTRSLDEIVWAVNPKWDDVDSLVGYLGNFAQRFLAAAGIQRNLDLPTDLPPMRLPSQARHNLFLCCKEALNNAVKHAQAKEVTFAISATDSLLRIAIADDGIGLAAAKRDSSTNPQRLANGNGIQNMRSRMEQLGGRFSISDRPGGGTIVTFSLALPLKKNLRATSRP